MATGWEGDTPEGVELDPPKNRSPAGASNAEAPGAEPASDGASCVPATREGAEPPTTVGGAQTPSAFRRVRWAAGALRHAWLPVLVIALAICAGVLVAAGAMAASEQQLRIGMPAHDELRLVDAVLAPVAGWPGKPDPALREMTDPYLLLDAHEKRMLASYTVTVPAGGAFFERMTGAAVDGRLSRREAAALIGEVRVNEARLEFLPPDIKVDTNGRATLRFDARPLDLSTTMVEPSYFVTVRFPQPKLYTPETRFPTVFVRPGGFRAAPLGTPPAEQETRRVVWRQLNFEEVTFMLYRPRGAAVPAEAGPVLPRALRWGGGFRAPAIDPLLEALCLAVPLLLFLLAPTRARRTARLGAPDDAEIVRLVMLGILLVGIVNTAHGMFELVGSSYSLDESALIGHGTVARWALAATSGANAAGYIVLLLFWPSLVRRWDRGRRCVTSVTRPRAPVFTTIAATVTLALAMAAAGYFPEHRPWEVGVAEAPPVDGVGAIVGPAAVQGAVVAAMQPVGPAGVAAQTAASAVQTALSQMAVRTEYAARADRALRRRATYQERLVGSAAIAAAAAVIIVVVLALELAVPWYGVLAAPALLALLCAQQAVSGPVVLGVLLVIALSTRWLLALARLQFAAWGAARFSQRPQGVKWTLRAVAFGLAILLAWGWVDGLEPRVYDTLVNAAIAASDVQPFARLILGTLLVRILYRVSRTPRRQFGPEAVAAGALLGALAFFPPSTAWFYVPVTFLVGWRVLGWLIGRRAARERRGRIPPPGDPSFSHEVLEEIVDVKVFRRTLHAYSATLLGKVSKGEMEFTDYEKKREAQQALLREKEKALRDRIHLHPEAALARYAHRDPWENALVNATWATAFGLPWMFLYLRDAGSYGPPSTAGFLLQAFLVVAQWPMYGFFFGYFYARIPGWSGFAKSLRFAAALVVPGLVLNAVSLSPTAGWMELGFFALQVLIQSLLLGLANDVAMVRRHGFTWRTVLDLHNLGAVTAWVSTLVLAIVTAVTTILTTQATDLFRRALEASGSVPAASATSPAKPQEGGGR